MLCPAIRQIEVGAESSPTFSLSLTILNILGRRILIVLCPLWNFTFRKFHILKARWVALERFWVRDFDIRVWQRGENHRLKTSGKEQIWVHCPIPYWNSLLVLRITLFSWSVVSYFRRWCCGQVCVFFLKSKLTLWYRQIYLARGKSVGAKEKQRLMFGAVC